MNRACSPDTHLSKNFGSNVCMPANNLKILTNSKVEECDFAYLCQQSFCLLFCGFCQLWAMFKISWMPTKANPDCTTLTFSFHLPALPPPAVKRYEAHLRSALRVALSHASLALSLSRSVCHWARILPTCSAVPSLARFTYDVHRGWRKGTQSEGKQSTPLFICLW